MSRVTIEDLYCEYCDAKKWRELKDIAIVPRKVVEMIINECTNIIDVYAGNSNYDCGRSCTAVDIKTLAELLLKKFEEDGKI